MGFANIQLINGPDIVRPTLELTISTVQNFEIDVQEDDGRPVDLTDYDVLDSGPEADVPCQRGRDLPITTGVQFVAAEFQGQTQPSASITCEVVDAANGVINIPINACSFTKPGLYLAEVQLIKDGELHRVFKMYVDAQASLAWVVNGPLTIAEVRLWARDSTPDDNFLLDEVEFKDAEIVAAIRRAVDIWNSTTPVLTRYTFTAASFPFRSQWLDLTLALLYDIAAKSYLRNHLPYAAAGVQVDDKNKYNQYRQLANEEKQKYEQWAKETKIQLNAQQCWGRSNILFTGAGGRVYTYADYFRY
jgi:hypothetical protein